MSYMTNNSYNKESSAYDFSDYYDYDVPMYDSLTERNRYKLFETKPSTKSASGSSRQGGSNTKYGQTHRVGRKPGTEYGRQRGRGYARVSREAAERAAKLKNRIKIVAVCAIAVATWTLLIISQVQSHELTRSIELKQSELETLQQEYDIMMDRFNTEMSDSAVEEYAISELGMQKCEGSQCEYVSLGSDEYFEFGAENGSSWTTYTGSN